MNHVQLHSIKNHHLEGMSRPISAKTLFQKLEDRLIIDEIRQRQKLQREQASNIKIAPRPLTAHPGSSVHPPPPNKESSKEPKTASDDEIKKLNEEIASLRTELACLRESDRLKSEPVVIDKSNVSHAVLDRMPSRLNLPETTQRGISVKGLRIVDNTIRELTQQGRFSEDRQIDGTLFHGTSDYDKVKTTQVVYMWVKKDTGDKRLADCPLLVPSEEIGMPKYFVSHAWKGSWSKLLNVVFDFVKEKSLPEDTKFWLDCVSVNQHGDVNRAQNKEDVDAFQHVLRTCSDGTVVYFTSIQDMKDSEAKELTCELTTASRAWCLYEWDWSLTHHGPSGIHFRGMDMRDVVKLMSSLDVSSSQCFSAKDKRWILDSMMQHHGSKPAFNNKLSHQIKHKLLMESLPPSTKRGITIRGLKRLDVKVKELFDKGRFNTEQNVGTVVCPPVHHYKDITVQHAVSLFFRHPDFTGDINKAISECPEHILPEDLGIPDFFISHAYKGSWSKTIECVFSVLQDASEETCVWMDHIALPKYDNACALSAQEHASKGIIAPVDLERINPATRLWVLYEWSQALAVHGPGSLAFADSLTSAERDELAKSIDSKNATCSDEADFKFITETINKAHGSMQAFDAKLKLQVLLRPMPFKMRQAEMSLLLERSKDKTSHVPCDLSVAKTFVNDLSDKGSARALAITGGPGSGKSTLSAMICDELLKAKSKGEDDPVSCYHFVKRGERYNHPASIVSSLCAQLAEHIPVLQDYVLGLSALEIDSLKTKDARSAVRYLLSPLCKPEPLYVQPIIILIDGLDEEDPSKGSNSASSNQVWELLDCLAEELPRNVRFILSARIESVIVPDVKRQLISLFGDPSKVIFQDALPWCICYQTITSQCHLVDRLPLLSNSAGVEDVYSAFKAVFDRQKPSSETMRLISSLVKSPHPLSLHQLEQQGYKKKQLWDLPGWGVLFHESQNLVFLLSRLLRDWLSDKEANREYSC